MANAQLRDNWQRLMHLLSIVEKKNPTLISSFVENADLMDMDPKIFDKLGLEKPIITKTENNTEDNKSRTTSSIKFNEFSKRDLNKTNKTHALVLFYHKTNMRKEGTG